MALRTANDQWPGREGDRTYRRNRIQAYRIKALMAERLRDGETIQYRRRIAANDPAWY
jgi:hypothetical protein